jgi:type III pantothenate kinase
MRVEYTPRNALGVDRLCCILGARELYGGSTVVVDFGTATTFNVIDDNGDFAGGWIAPGISASFRALHGETAQLPLLNATEWTRMPPLFGRNTRDSIAAGVLWGAWLAVRGMVEEASKGFRNPGRVLLTGGAAPLFAGIADADWISDEHVLLKGAASFAMRWRRSG